MLLISSGNSLTNSVASVLKKETNRVASSVNLQGLNVIVITALKFDNESIGVLTYTSIGGKGMEKERIEIFYNRSSFVIRDFAELSTFSCDFGNIKLKEMDKGHKALIKELNKKLKNVESLILPFKTDIEMTRFTLEVVDKIHRIKQS